MGEKIEFRTIWRSAGVPGVVLAAVSIAYMLANFYLTEAAFTGSAIVVFLLDLAKIVGCIWLMNLYLTRFKEDNDGATRRDLRRLGKWIAILSALIFSAAMMAFYQLHTEVIAEAMDSVMQIYGDSMDTNAMNQLEKMEGSYPQILFVSNFIYCSIFGWVLSAILSARIISDNPFDDDEDSDDADEQ